MVNPNILSKRYATKEMNDLFSEEGITLAEREFWIAVMKAQQELGVNIPKEAIQKYEVAKKKINLERIRQIEEKTKHDIKAKIEGFVEAAGAKEYIHMGLTSRDLTENTEQVRFRKAGRIVLGKYIAILNQLMKKAKEYKNIVLVARTHHQPAQCTLLGRRLAMWAEELCLHVEAFEHFLEEYPLRGIKGPVGTQFDLLTLLGSKEKVEKLEKKMADALGFKKSLCSPGQVYPRSLDFALVSRLAALASACENMSKGIRLMAGAELVTEGFRPGQVGSSSMPHKMNTRHTEQVCSFSELLKMYVDGASRLMGDQWEEGDISCSVLRRVILPDAFYISDGLCETFLNVLKDMGPYPKMLEKELERYLPFLASSELLMMAVKVGMGREEAHELIKKHATAAALRLREGKSSDFIEGLANERLFKGKGVSVQKMQLLFKDTEHFVGNAKVQIEEVGERVDAVCKRHPKEAKYQPQEVL